jgi:hypothetical protein
MRAKCVVEFYATACATTVEEAILSHLRADHGFLMAAKLARCCGGAVRRVKRNTPPCRPGATDRTCRAVGCV